MERVAKEADSSEFCEQAGSVIFIIEMDVDRDNKLHHTSASGFPRYCWVFRAAGQRSVVEDCETAFIAVSLLVVLRPARPDSIKET